MIAVLNFGGQYAHLIARRIRELGVKSELVPPDITVDKLKKLSPVALIFSGSPFSVYEKNAPQADPQIYNLGLPILGICYGHQLMARQLGGQVSSHSQKQFGKEIINTKKSPLFTGLAPKQTVWFSHGDQVDRLPAGFQSIASSSSAKIAACENIARKLYSIQFHAEVTHTPNGQKILGNFIFKIAKAQKDWDLQSKKKELIKKLAKSLSGQDVLMALSGGVDSLVAASLLKKAIGERLHFVFIDTGLLRSYDLADLKEIIRTVKFKNFKILDAKARFLKALRGVTDPEQKRQKIAALYFTILEEKARKIPVKYLGQGTIYPDRIESGNPTKHADKIKSHHNVTLPKGLKLALIEPLADFYKDEVRRLGRLLGLAEHFVSRHPFPGPGLAIRILGEVTQERLTIARAVDEIFITELKKSGIYNQVAQAFAALLPVKSVGVMGDARTYSYMVSLRSVDTADFMTADWSKIPYPVLEKVASKIVNEVRGVNRVVYDITQKPPATIEYE